MGNVFHVLARDVKRLLTTPATWAVMLFLVVLPSLYTWFNVTGFWNPYDNTGNLRVCIVNEDEGAQVEGIGELDLGERIVEQLAGNDQLGWAFVTRDEAAEEVRSGTAYAAFVMPSDFSADVASLLSGDFRQPQIEYHVNEKVGPVAPKITDTGAGALDATINETFVSVVSETVATLLDEELAKLDQAGSKAKSEARERIGKARSALAETRGKLAGLAADARSAGKTAEGARSALADAQAQIDRLTESLALASTLAARADASLIGFSATANATIGDGTGQLARLSAGTSASIAKDANAILAAKGSVDGAVARGRAISQEADQLVDRLKDLQGSLPASDAALAAEALERLEDAGARAREGLAGLGQLASDIGDLAESAGGAANTADTAAQRALEDAADLSAALNTAVVPAISEALAATARTAGDLSAQAASQTSVLNEASLALGGLSSTLGTAAGALAETDAKLGGVDEELAALETDLASLGSSGALAQVMGTSRIDPASIADFMMSPTRLSTEQLYPLDAYGSAMAPLFINLTLWIGVFMLMVIMRLEVDEEGIERLTITQRFFGRFLLLVPLVCAQAAVCCTGCLVIGVQSASVPAFYATAIVASLAYLAVQYTLSTTLQHVGKAICVILVFVQIPGASGLYPIEMTPSFFQVVYPLFPFTYGINAIRETIGGFYDGQWLACVGVLVAFMAAFLLIGTVARPYLTNLNRMFARQIAESDLIVGEDVELPARRWRMSQVLQALSDREEYRVALERRVGRFMQVYPALKTGALVAGLLVPMLVTAVLVPLGVGKVAILSSWLAWLVLVVTFLLAVEFFRDNLSHQLSLEAMDADQMRALMGSRNRFTRVQPLAQDIVPDGDAPANGGAGAIREDDGEPEGDGRPLGPTGSTGGAGERDEVRADASGHGGEDAR